MKPMLINGLTKEKFAAFCYEKADELRPGWRKEVFFTDDEIPTEWIWKAPREDHGFALSALGINLLEKCLGMEPYIIETDRSLSSELILDLAHYMPWPYYIVPNLPGSKLHIYSREVAVWAALQNNDIEKIIHMYKMA